MSTPRLWSIVCHPPWRHEFWYSKLDLWLSRSGNSPLRLDFQVCDLLDFEDCTFIFSESQITSMFRPHLHVHHPSQNAGYPHISYPQLSKIQIKRQFGFATSAYPCSILVSTSRNVFPAASLPLQQELNEARHGFSHASTSCGILWICCGRYF